MIDLGLTTGIKDLWQENLLRDYTLVVEGQEFQVHKVVLASVSKYFKVMLSEGYIESKVDKVNVTGFSSDIVSKLLDLIYTGEESIIADDTLEVLRCSMYLQMPLVSQFCVKKLVENLNVRNCLEVLSTTIEFTFPREVTKVKNFIQRNWGMLLENYKLEAISYDTVQLLMDCCPKSQWEEFLFLKNWIYVNYPERITHVNDLMSQVRFCLIGPKELQCIKEMDIFSNTEGPWQDLVENAVKYSQLPIHHKVLDRTEQSEVKGKPLLTFFTSATSDPSQNETHFYVLDRENKWRKHRQNIHNSPVIDLYAQGICIEVNNFLVLCATGEGAIQQWWIFDPRTLIWTKMTCMEKPKVDFEMVHYNGDLYLVGGEDLSTEIASREMEQYSFRTDKWTSVHKLPTALKGAGTCVLGDTIFISGGRIMEVEFEDKDGSDGLYSLNLSSPNQEWERKTNCLDKCAGNHMFAVRRGKEEVLLVVDFGLQMQLYSPSMDQWARLQWTRLSPEQIPGQYECLIVSSGMVLARGNALFLLNVKTPILDLEDYSNEEPIEEKHLTLCWEIPEEKQEITELDRQQIPAVDEVTSSSIFGGMLTFPPQYSGQELPVIEVSSLP